MLENIIYKFEAVGKEGKPITIRKFRTMRHGAHDEIEEIINNHGFGEYGKIKNDPRITPIGKFLRRYFLDETPQLWNFLKGEMNFIGIRPLKQGFIELYPEDLIEEYKRTGPGMIAVTYDQSVNSWEDRMKAERQYFKERREHHYRTDMKYFLRFAKNFFFKGVRGS